MMVACENGKHRVVSTMLRELHTREHREVYEEVLRKNGAKVCTYVHHTCSSAYMLCYSLTLGGAHAQ